MNIISKPSVAFLLLYYLMFHRTRSEKSSIASLVFAIPPTNDLCSNATSYELGSVVRASLFEATAESGENGKRCLNYGSPGVWYKFVGTGESLVGRSCNPANYLVIMSIFTGGCDSSVNSLVCVATELGTCDNRRFIFDTKNGTLYHMLIESKLVSSPEFTIFPVPEPVQNDFCNQSQPITIGKAVSVNTTYIRSDDVDLDAVAVRPCQNRPNEPGVWYSFIGNGKGIVFRSCIDSGVISIYTRGCGLSRQCIGYFNAPCTSTFYTFNTTLGTKYNVLLQSHYKLGLSGLFLYDPAIVTLVDVRNDHCTQAKFVNNEDIVTVDLKNATSDIANVKDDCAGFTDLTRPGVWFDFSGTGNITEIDPCVGAIPNAHFSISVYDGNCGKESLSCLAVGELRCQRNVLQFETVRGVVYHVLVQSLLTSFFPLVISNVGLGTTLAPATPTPAPRQVPVPPEIPVPSCTARITNGEIILGVACDGHLIDAFDGTGLRLFTPNATFEALALGPNQSEGWGVSATDFVVGTSFAGYSNFFDAGNNFTKVVSFTPNAKEAESVVNVTSGSLQVTHSFKPSFFTPSLYECTVTFKNVGRNVLTDLRYRRSLKWNIKSSLSCIDIDVGLSTDLEYISNQIALVSDPRGVLLSNRGNISLPNVTCPYGKFPCPIKSVGPYSQGTDMVFFLNETDGITPRTLLSGESTSFKIYYGATRNKSMLASALSLLPDSEKIAASVFAYGDTTSGNCVNLGEPAIFVFGFSPLLIRTRATASPMSSPTTSPLANITDVPLALIEIMKSNASNIGKFLDNEGNAIRELRPFIDEFREQLVTGSRKGLAISRSLNDKDVLLLLMPNTFVVNAQSRNLCTTEADCALLIADLVASIIALCLSIVPGLASLAAGPLLARNVGSAIARNALTGPLQKGILQLTQSFDDGLSNGVKIGRLFFEILAGVGFSQFLGIMSKEFDNFDPERSAKLGLSVLATLLGIFASGGATIIAALAVNLGVGFYELIGSIDNLGDKCNSENICKEPMPPVSPPMTKPITPPTPTGMPPTSPNFSPSFEGSRNPRPRVSFANGDPHITTLDGLDFDCQARGEFIMLKSLDSSFQLQSRFTKVTAPGTLSIASVTSGLAVREKGTPKLQISLKSGIAESSTSCLNLVSFFEDGIERPLGSGTLSSAVKLSVLNGAEIVINYVATGLEIHVLVRSSQSFGCFLTFWIVLPENYRVREELFGLLGNANGDPYDDWQTNLRVALPIPIGNASLFQGGYDYCRQEWCIRNESDSLFTYINNETFQAYFDCDAPYETNLEKSVASATKELRDLCGTIIECLIDGTVGNKVDAIRVLEDVALANEVLKDLNITYNFPSTTKAPNQNPSKAPTIAPIPEPCGLFSLNIFCPFSLRGIIGRFIRRIFGWA